MENGAIVLVVWKDAQTTGGPGWEDAEDIQEAALAEACIVHSVGYLLSHSVDSIAICDTIQSDGQAGGNVHLIPNEMIQQIYLLNSKEEDNVRPYNYSKFGTQHGDSSEHN